MKPTRDHRLTAAPDPASEPAGNDDQPPPAPPRRPTRAEVEARWSARDEARAFHEALGGRHTLVDPRDLERDHWTRWAVLVERGLVGGGR